MTSGYYVAARSSAPPSPERSVRLSLTLWQMLAQIASQHNARTTGRPPSTPAIGDNLVVRVQALALKNPAEYCNSRRIAQALGVSLQKLNRHFQQASGKSLGEFLRTQRICRARDLLNTSQLSIKEIAAARGFSSPQTFSRTFKQMLKIPPRRYRAQRK